MEQYLLFLHLSPESRKVTGFLQPLKELKLEATAKRNSAVYHCLISAVRSASSPETCFRVRRCSEPSCHKFIW